MNKETLCSLTVILVLGSVTLVHADVIKQEPGAHYLVFEAEAYDELEGDPEFGGWVEVFPDEEFESNIGNPVLPEDSNVSGSAMFDSDGGTNFVDNLNYSLEFAEAGFYSVYLRYTMFDMQNETNYGNEDSFYFPLELDDIAEQDGWFSLQKHGHNDSTEDPPYWEGQFHWMGPFNFDSGEPVEYEVSDGDVGQALDFQISQRERGSTLDAVVFSTELDLFEEELDEILFGNANPGTPGDFDNNGALEAADVNSLMAEILAGTNNVNFNLDENTNVNGDDLTVWVHDLKGTWFGDANLDGEFNSGDLVSVFSIGKYETGNAAGWDEGDWDASGMFDSGDFVKAFSDGGYEQGPRGNPVPEPGSVVLLALGGLALVWRRRL